MAKSIPFNVIDWNSEPVEMFEGETGTAQRKTVVMGGLRVRVVRYSENYTANHWCSLGHIVYCVAGEFISELADGRSFTVSAGMSYQVSDSKSAHRTTSKNGATVFIVDGAFLGQDKPSMLNPWRV